MITITVEKDTITVALTGLAEGLADTSPVMDDIAQYLFKDARERFVRESAPDGSVWAPRSQTTLDAYRRQGSPWGRILQKEGALIDSLAVRSGNGFAEIFVNRPYARMMQFGGTKSRFPHLWGNIPARPFLGFEQPQIDAISEIVSEWFQGLAE